MANYYPPVGFHFQVEVLGLAGSANDLRFTEVAGLGVEMTTEEVAEGGENRFLQKYPIRARYPELVLKRGLLVSSPLVEWVKGCIDDFDIQPKEVNVTLLNEEHQPLMVWHLAGAYPTKWAVSDLNASSNTVVIESMNLFYRFFRAQKG
ncbi:MAG: phage tail protein [Thermodesulfobacteriota bacterium]